MTNSMNFNYLESLSDDTRLIGLGKKLRQLIESNDLSKKELSKKLKIPYRSLMNYLEDRRAITFKLTSMLINLIAKNKNDYNKLLNKLITSEIKLKSISSNSTLVQLPKEITKELAYLIGALHDGTVFKNEAKNQYVVQFIQHSNKTWLKEIEKLIKKVFNIKPKFYKGYIQISSKIITEFFSNYFHIPQHQSNWNSFLSKIPKEFHAYTIAGFFDAEGWCGDKDDIRIKLSQKNENKLKEIKKALESINVKCGSVVEERKIYHALYICDSNCIKFIEEIGRLSLYQKKIKRMNNILNLVGKPLIGGS